MRTATIAAALLLAGCSGAPITAPHTTTTTTRAHEAGPRIETLDAALRGRWLRVGGHVHTPTGGNVQVLINADGNPFTGYSHGFEYVITGDGEAWVEVRAIENGEWGTVQGRALVRYLGEHLTILAPPLDCEVGGTVRAYVNDAEGIGFDYADAAIR